ncbi:MAG: DUF1104 domain-containing protein [Sulfurimonas sp.]|nr:MAG: DUF1104 domain-containing protein [Sulfurimonas sp.]
MTKTILSFFLTSFFVLSLYAADNYSEMSTQELISIIGYVKKDEVKNFTKELELRVPKMSADEKKMYQENLNKIK